MEPCGFNKLLKKRIPHIHEKIILSLDYDTFIQCEGVCETWDELLATASFRKKAYSVFGRQMDIELTTSTECGNIDRVKLLLDYGVDPNASISDTLTGGLTPLHYGLVFKAPLEIFQLLLERGADPRRELILHAAVVYGDVNVVKLLLDYGGYTDRADSAGQTPRWIAKAMEKTDIVKLLQDAGAAGP